MLKHSQIWNALDALAAKHGMSVSGLAKAAGLDPTTFNKSKRMTPEGRERWPSTESVAKVLVATNETLDNFVVLVTTPGTRVSLTLPLLDYARAGQDRNFDKDGRPQGNGWDEVELPAFDTSGNAYAIEVSGDAMLPLCRDGDLVIVSVTEPVRRGDRVFVRTRNGTAFVSILKRETAKTVELHMFDITLSEQILEREDIISINRIIWLRQ